MVQISNVTYLTLRTGNLKNPTWSTLSRGTVNVAAKLVCVFFFFCMHDYVYRIKAHKFLLHELQLATEWTRRSSDRLYPISEGKESQLTEKQQCRLTNFQEYTNDTTPNKHKVKPEKTKKKARPLKPTFRLE